MKNGRYPYFMIPFMPPNMPIQVSEDTLGFFRTDFKQINPDQGMFLRMIADLAESWFSMAFNMQKKK